MLNGRRQSSSEHDPSGFSRKDPWRHLWVRPKTIYKTTWTARLLLAIVLLALAMLTRSLWVPALAWHLVCGSDTTGADILLVENLDPDYLLFEQAADRINRGQAQSALVLVQASGKDPEKSGLVSQGIAELMIKVARLRSVELLPIEQEEPITLNVARQVAEHLKSRSNVSSLLILTPGLRSKRTHLVFSTVLVATGIKVSCFPVWGTQNPDNWTTTWHGIQEVCLQHVKLLYYRLFVLPRLF
jgi:hypothetical protein